MLAKFIEEGAHYIARVGYNLTIVRVDQINTREGSGCYNGRGTRATTRYCVTNLVTGRTTVFRSALKFLREVAPHDVAATVTVMTQHKQRNDAMRTTTPPADRIF